MKLSIIIPVYNEIAKIGAVLDRLQRLTLPEGWTKEIIVVDDGSVDGTASEVERYEREGIAKTHLSPVNFGKGIAIRQGLRLVNGDVIIIQDADLEYDIGEYPKLLEPFSKNKASVVYGSRFRGSIKGMKWSNRLVNVLLKDLTNLLYGTSLTDEATCYKLFRSEILLSIPLRCKRFEFCPEVTAKVIKRGYQIYEVPISYTARNVAEGKKIRWYDALIAVWTLVKYRFVE